MPTKSINLLPTELEVKSNAGKLLKAVNKLTIFLGVIFVILAVVGGSAIFLLSRSNNSLLDKRQSLADQVSALETAEQNIVIAKDRLGKIAEVLGKRSLESTFEKQKDVILSSGSEIEFQESELSRDNSTIRLLSSNSSSLKNLLDTLENDPETFTIGSALLKELQFSAFQGFNLILQIR